MARLQAMSIAYNAIVERGEQTPTPAERDSSLISWNRNLEGSLAKGLRIEPRQDQQRGYMYRPFFRQRVQFNRDFNAMRYRLSDLFPTPAHENVGFVVMSPRADNDNFGMLMVGEMPDLSFFTYTGQFFARWRYEPVVADADKLALDAEGDGEVVDGYRRIDNITIQALRTFQAVYGASFTKDDIFHYVYGLLHSPDYRATYAADLKKSLPHPPRRRCNPLRRGRTGALRAAPRLRDRHPLPPRRARPRDRSLRPLRALPG